MDKDNVVQASLQLLGAQQEDKVSGFIGTAVSVAFDAYGCVQVFLAPRAVKGQMKEGQWFDVKRLKPKGARLMPVPSFGVIGSEPGGMAKPAPASGPR